MANQSESTKKQKAQKNFDEVLRRMLSMPPEPRKSKSAKQIKKKTAK